jgi:hypothetical protein
VKRFTCFACLILAGAMTGCASKQQKAVMLENANDESFQNLVNSTRDIQRRWGVTSRLSSIKFKEKKQTLDVRKLDASLSRVLAFPGGYANDIENFVLQMASLSGYDYIKPAGSKPVRGIPVTFVEEYRTIGEYVYDAGQQAGSRGTVVMDMKNKTLQIIYEGF